MKQLLVDLLLLAGVTLIAYALISVALSNWAECREHFSFLYCFTQLR